MNSDKLDDLEEDCYSGCLGKSEMDVRVVQAPSVSIYGHKISFQQPMDVDYNLTDDNRPLEVDIRQSINETDSTPMYVNDNVYPFQSMQGREQVSFESGQEQGIKAVLQEPTIKYAKTAPNSMSEMEFMSKNYNMQHPRRGKVIIINNMKYSNKRQRPEREESIRDASAMENVLQHLLKFEPINRRANHPSNVVMSNQSTTNIMQIVEDATNPELNDYTDYDCFVMCILSYGIDGAVMCCDGDIDRLIAVEKIVEPFKNNNCLSLAMKPKLFFLQLCPAYSYDIADDISPGKTKLVDPEMRKIPQEADLLLQVSTLPANYGWYDDDDALSWYIDSLKRSLMKHIYYPLEKGKKSSDIMTMLLCANRLFREKMKTEGITPSREYNLPTITSTLTKHLCFFPS